MSEKNRKNNRFASLRKRLTQTPESGVVVVGDCRDVLERYASASVLFDSVVCDPPYELGFMGKKWDSTGIAYDIDMWRSVLREIGRAHV